MPDCVLRPSSSYVIFLNRKLAHVSQKPCRHVYVELHDQDGSAEEATKVVFAKNNQLGDSSRTRVTLTIDGSYVTSSFSLSSVFYLKTFQNCMNYAVYLRNEKEISSWIEWLHIY